MKKIAILGVTGYIGRSLLQEFFVQDSKKYRLFLFSRTPEKLHTHIVQAPKKTEYSVHGMDEFSKHAYDVIINCTGISNIASLEKDAYEIFKVTEEVDTLIISYLKEHPQAMYVNLSSGAVYGGNFESPVSEKVVTKLSSGFIGHAESYAIAKINAEAKHRALSMYNIVDIRIFAFFSALVDTDSPFLMSEIAKCIFHKKVFETTKDNITRDYATAKDLLSLIQCCIKKDKLNDYFDMYSKKAISKFALLDALTKKYALVHKVVKPQKKSTSAAKNSYFSKSKKATTILGYAPEYTSLEGIIHELDKLGL